jgi:GTP-dependent phosphoenolpyruvate carboxykinase
MAPEWEDPAGVPIDAMLLGGRRSTVVPLVTEARDWEHGVFLGATMSSETTAAAADQVGQLRFDPFAMLPFCGYNMADYMAHWLKIGEREGAQLPKIFYVNWFRKDEDGKFVWPGFGENSRVLEWVYNRCKGENKTHDTSLGLLPYTEDLNLEGLDLTSDDIADILSSTGSPAADRKSRTTRASRSSARKAASSAPPPAAPIACSTCLAPTASSPRASTKPSRATWCWVATPASLHRTCWCAWSTPPTCA